MRINWLRWVGYAGVLVMITVASLDKYSKQFQKSTLIQSPSPPVLGIDYVLVSHSEIAPPIFPQQSIVVLEFFSYRCKACHILEEPIRAWLALHTSLVRFERIPLYDETPYVDWIIRLHYLAHQLKPNITDTLFKWFSEGQNIRDPSVIKKNLMDLGISPEDYERVMSQQSGLDAQIARGKNLQKVYHIEEPLTFIIGGYYKTSLSMVDGDLTRLFETIDVLIEKLRKADE